MSAQEIAAGGETSPTNSTCAAEAPAHGPALLGRKSLLLGMLTSGLVVANAAQSSSATAATAATVRPAALAATDTQVLQMVPPNANGTYTKPAAGTPLYLAFQSSAKLPLDWGYCLSTASSLTTPSMGTLKVLGAPAGGGIEVEYQGATPIVENDGTIICAPAAGGTKYRSEVVFQSDRTDGINNYTNFRYVAGQRIRIAFDVMTHGLDTQTGVSWNSIFQSIGMSKNGAWPQSNISINVEPGVWIIQGGAAYIHTEWSPRSVHQDGIWTRWELDILLGGPGVGYVSIWKDGEPICYQWKMPSGTFYAGTGNNSVDLSWLYFKNGLYGAAATSAIAPKAMFRNRRFSVTTAAGVTTTWRGQQTNSGGLNLYRRNPVSDMPF